MGGTGTISSVGLIAALSARPVKLTMETDYGLILEAQPDGAFNARLRESIIKSTAEAGPTIEKSDDVKPRFHYEVWPSWGTSHLWSDSEWPSNPKAGDIYSMDDEDVLQDQGGTVEEEALVTWLEAYNAWAKTFDDAFDKELNQTGDFYRDIFPDLNVRRAWILEGLMLAIWLALLPGVDAVDFSPDSTSVVFSTTGHSEHVLNEATRLFLEGLDLNL